MTWFCLQSERGYERPTVDNIDTVTELIKNVISRAEIGSEIIGLAG
jgi:cell division ATPase FtsA